MGNNKKRQDHGLSVRSQWDLGGLGPGGHEHEAKRTRASGCRARASAIIDHPARSAMSRPGHPYTGHKSAW